MIKYFYLLSLLLYVNTALCYDYYEQENPHRNVHNHGIRHGRLRRKRVERRGANFGSEYGYRSPVQQFDVASFVQQRSHEDALDDDEPREYRINKRRTTKNYDYDNELNTYEKKQDYPNPGTDDITELKNNPTYTKYNSDPKQLDFNNFESEDIDLDKLGHNKVRNAYEDDDTSPHQDQKQAKKSIFSKVKLPFFSHRQSAENSSMKDKKRKLFCINCPKKDNDDGDKGTNGESSDEIIKKEVTKRKRSNKDSFSKKIIGDYTSDLALHDKLSRRNSHKVASDTGLISDENNKKKKIKLKTATNSSLGLKNNVALSKPISKHAEINHLGADDANIGEIGSSKESTAIHKHKKFSLKNMKFPFLFNKQSHKSSVRQFDVPNLFQKNSEDAIEYSDIYVDYPNKRHSSHMVDYGRGLTSYNNDKIQLNSNPLDSMKVPFFSHDQSPTLISKQNLERHISKVFEEQFNGEFSNEIQERPDKMKSKRSAKEYLCPLCKKRFYSDLSDNNGKESESFYIKEEEIKNINKRSYKENICPACMKRCTDNPNENGKQKIKDIIHNSRQFYQTFNEFDNSTQENQVITEPEDAINGNSREKRNDPDRERQLQELDAVEKKIQAVRVNVRPKVASGPPGQQANDP